MMMKKKIKLKMMRILMIQNKYRKPKNYNNKKNRLEFKMKKIQKNSKMKKMLK